MQMQQNIRTLAHTRGFVSVGLTPKESPSFAANLENRSEMTKNNWRQSFLFVYNALSQTAHFTRFRQSRRSTKRRIFRFYANGFLKINFLTHSINSGVETIDKAIRFPRQFDF